MYYCTCYTYDFLFSYDDERTVSAAQQKSWSLGKKWAIFPLNPAAKEKNHLIFILSGMPSVFCVCDYCFGARCCCLLLLRGAVVVEKVSIAKVMVWACVKASENNFSSSSSSYLSTPSNNPFYLFFLIRQKSESCRQSHTFFSHFYFLSGFK